MISSRNTFLVNRTLPIVTCGLLLRAAKRNYENFPVPTKLVEGEAHKRKYTDAEKADLDIKTSVNKIGEIINLSQEHCPLLRVDFYTQEVLRHH